MSRTARTTLAALLAATTVGLTAAPLISPAAAETPSDGIVRRNGTSLVLDGSPYRFSGYQIGLGASPARPRCTVYADDAVGPALQQARQASGANAVRVWMFQSYGGPTDWRRFDLVFAEARKVGVKVVVTLTNQWGDCEPEGPDGRPVTKHLPWYQSGYQALDAGYGQSFRDFTRSMAERYRAEPALLAWQLVNEGEARRADGSCDAVAARAALRAFSDDMVAVVRGAGSPHLVNLGSMGNGQCGLSGSADFRYVHAGALDLCEVHDYAVGAMPGDQWNGLQTRISDCAAVGKPLFIGEVGIQRGVQADGSTGTVTSETLARRASLLDAKLQAQVAAGVVGHVVWQRAQSDGDGFTVFPGDPVESVLLRRAPATSPAPSTSPSPSPSASPSPAPAPVTSAAPQPEPVVLGERVLLSGSSGRTGRLSTDLTAAGGTLRLRLETKRPVSATLTLRTATGAVVATRTGTTPLSLSADLARGSYGAVVTTGRNTSVVLYARG